MFTPQRFYKAKLVYAGVYLVLAHMSPLSLLDGHAPSSVRRRLSTITMIFFSETAWPIKVKTVCGAFLGRGNAICINGSGHMTKMAALAINSKNR